MSDLQLVGAFSAGFSHAYSTTLWKRPKYFRWVYNQVLPITFWFDNSIEQGVYIDCPNRFAWLLEGHAIVPQAVEFVKNNVELVSRSYKYLFTHSKEISELAPNFHLIFPHGYWNLEAKLYPKNKLVSMVCSNKGFTEGHRKRMELIERFKGKVDLFGRGFNDFEKHEDVFADYCFTFSLENLAERYYITEKFMSPASMGTISIVWPESGVQDLFNPEGIILLDENFDIDKLTLEEYNKRLPAVIDNLERVKAYNNIEDILWEKYLKNLQ